MAYISDSDQNVKVLALFGCYLYSVRCNEHAHETYTLLYSQVKSS